MFLKRAGLNPIDGHFFAFRDIDVVSALAKGHYDVLWLWGYNYLTHQLAALSQILRRQPVIFHENQTLLDHRPAWKRLLKRSWLPLLFPRGRALFVGAENYRWFRHYGVPDNRLFFAPYAVDNQRFQTEAAELRSRKGDLQKRLGVRPNAGPIILMVSRLIPKKDPFVLLEAFRRVRSREHCSLVFVGSGELEDELKRRIREQSIRDVHLVGFVNQSTIGQVYAAADVFALPSGERETWGLAVNEAMNFSLPLLVSDKVGCAVDLVKNGENGYVFPSGSVDELTDRLSRLVSDERARERFGTASSRIVADWNYDAAALGVTRAIADAAGRSRWKEASGQDQELAH